MTKIGTMMSNADEHFTGEHGKEVRERLTGFRDWAQREASYIHRDRFFDRAWWRLIDAADTVDAIMARYEKKRT